MDHFSHLFAVKLCFWLKRPKKHEKEAEDGPLKNRLYTFFQDCILFHLSFVVKNECT